MSRELRSQLCWYSRVKVTGFSPLPVQDRYLEAGIKTGICELARTDMDGAMGV